MLVDDCIFTGNGWGVNSGGLNLTRCTIVANDHGIHEQGSYGATATDSIVWGNTTSDYFNLSIGAFGHFFKCVGFTTGVSGAAAFNQVLMVNPKLWDLATGNLHLQPGSPCIDIDGAIDAGALQFDPAYGASFQDLGAGLAGSTGIPSLNAFGHMFPTGPVTLRLTNAPANGTAVLVFGLSPIFVPALGGTLVPSPTIIIAGLPLDGTGSLALTGPWPAGVPSSTTFVFQAWIPDAAAPFGFAASNGVQLTAP
jgi:hypothetical protein